MSKTNIFIDGVFSVYNILRSLVTLGGLNWNATDAQLKSYTTWLSGLRPINHYNQEYWSSAIKFNPMSEKPKVLVKDKNIMDVIRDLVYGSGAYIDIWFNDEGIIQFEPYDKNDFFNTGLHLVKPEGISNKFKFDTTNIFTQILVSNPEAKTDTEQLTGNLYMNDILYAFFGTHATSVRDKDVWVALGNKAEDTGTKSTSSSSSGSGTASNPFKGKKIWINADSGSDTRKNQVANILKNKGYSVHVSGTGPGYHYSDYTNVPANYVYITMYNGFCAGTIQEQYSSSILNKLKNKNVTMVVMIDTYYWTEKMKPYRYGDFTGKKTKRAWDDNTVNNNPSHQRLTVIHADNDALTTSLAGDPYPGTSGNTSLTDISIPSAKLFNANKDGKLFMGKPITDISESIDGTISFSFSNPKNPTGISQHKTSTTQKIYSISGQYMGTDLKKLPRGIYKVKNVK